MIIETSSPANENKIQVMIVDDHPAVIEGLSHRISAQPDMNVCAHASDVATAIPMVRELHPDVVIVDIALKSSDGLDLISRLSQQQSSVRAIVHSMYEESLYAERCLRAGARGYVNKGSSPDSVIEAIRFAMHGKIYLSPEATYKFLDRVSLKMHIDDDPIHSLSNRQLEVFRLIGSGKSTSQIATQLHISIHTVESHRENIKKKLKIHTIPELARRAVLWCSHATSPSMQFPQAAH